MGCQLVLVPCNPCSLIGQLFAYDCPIQTVTCPLYPFDTTISVNSFGNLLLYSLNQYLTNNGINIGSCSLNTLQTTWYVNVLYNNNPIINYQFFDGVGFNNPLSIPTEQNWYSAITSSFVELQDYGLTYYIDNDNSTITVYNNSCIPIDVAQKFELNVGINFNLLCNS